MDYILDRLKPDYPHREVMLDTKRILDEAITRAQKKPKAVPREREPGEEG
jgi:hypothetical protein